MPVTSGATGSDAAAWAQAIFSVVAIIAAGLFPLQQERLRTRRRVETYAALVRAAFVLSSRGALAMKNALGSNQPAHWSVTKWDRLVSAFAQIPYHDLPDQELLDVLHDADTAVLAFRDLWKRQIHVGERNGPVMEADVAAVTRINFDLRAAHDHVLDIAARYRGLWLLRWLRFNWLLAKIRFRLRGHPSASSGDPPA